jgi:ABC-type branched-subunit amino acid transport system ATPase component
MIRFIEIENFKTFGDRIRIDLDHPTVLIGPNNAGKTSVIQALALWSRAIKTWVEKKSEKELSERFSTGINRLTLLEVPVAETRYLWHGTHVRKANKPIEMQITVGLDFEGEVWPCGMIFTSRDAQVFYCRPDDSLKDNDELNHHAALMNFFLLYPMSGIMANISTDSEEPQLQDGRINVLLGQGQTAQMLRNICLKVIEQDSRNKTNDWEEIALLMDRLFRIKLHRPEFNIYRGSISMSYSQQDTSRKLDISLAGRGMQQVLLILSYLYWRQNSIIMIDEPDAHLELLRQRQIYEILKSVAAQKGCQVVIATHSEVILDEASDTNLNLLINGTVQNLAEQQEIKNALRTFGIEHYYRARVSPRILYIEGSTDVTILAALARKLSHTEAVGVLTDRLNCYYTRNIESSPSLENRLDQISGAYSDHHRKHFKAMKAHVPELRGVALLDSDNQGREDEIAEDYAQLYWRDYEIENYFITPDSIIKYVDSLYGPQISGDLFFTNDLIRTIVDSVLMEMVFNHDRQLLDEYHQSSAAYKRAILRAIKMSRFAAAVFEKYAKDKEQPALLRKGEYFRLIDFIAKEEIPAEVTVKLDYLVKYLSL